MSDPHAATPPTSPPTVPGATPQQQSATPQQQSATPQVRRTAAIVVTSLGALLLAAAATVFMVIAWERLRLPGKVGVVGAASAAFLFAGHQLQHRLSGVAAVLTHLGAVLAPLVAGAAAVALHADRPTVAVTGGAVGLIVLQGFDRMRSPILAAGRAFACAGVAVGLGVWLGISPALLLVAAAAVAALIGRWDESITTAFLAASTPIIGWAATFAEPGSLLPWVDDLSSMNQWLTSLVAVAAIVVVVAQIMMLAAPRLHTFRARTAATVATAVFAINLTAFADSAIAHPDVALLCLAVSVLAGRVMERIWTRSIGLYLDGWTWLVTGVTWTFLLSSSAPLALQSTELVASLLLLASWLLNDLLGPTTNEAQRPLARLLHGTGGPMSSLGIALSSISIAVATGHAAGAAVGLIAVGALFTVCRRSHRADLAMVTFVSALVAATNAPALLPAVSCAAVASATAIILIDLRRGEGPQSLQPLQWIALIIAAVATLAQAVVSEPTWWSTAMHLAAFAGSAVVLSRRTSVPDFVLPPRVALLVPILASLGDLRIAGAFAVVTGVALVLDRIEHHVIESEFLGLGLATAGTWMLAADAGMTAPEIYIAMPCLILAKLGFTIVRRGGSSWIGLAPAFGVFTLIGIAERLGGGGGWHAVAAGTVGIMALLIGVDRRWAGPSLVGALSLIAVVGVETSAYVLAVPLWMWLALGGSFLVGAGVYLERSADEEGTASLRTAWAAFQ